MAVEDENTFMPSLFNRNEEVRDTTYKKQVIPQNTYYDMGVAAQHNPETRHVCVFGISNRIRAEVIVKIRSMANVQRLEEGPNYINVYCDDIEDLEKLVNLNLSKINGEIIGVYRKNFGLVKSVDVYAKQKGLLERLKEYFFGVN